MRLYVESDPLNATAASFGPFYSSHSLRESMPIKPPTRNMAGDPPSFRKISPFVARHHSVVFIPKSPQSYRRFFLNFFASLKYPSTLVHSSKQSYLIAKKIAGLKNKKTTSGSPAFSRFATRFP